MAEQKKKSSPAQAWELAFAKDDEHAARLIAEGWEPFSAVYNPSLNATVIFFKRAFK